NVDVLEINGVNCANKWVAEHTIPPAADGFWYIKYKASVSWAHFEAK
ncbi:MAG: GH12 family glycosyl hydrolase domain-containing protein, partial [Brevinematia bacterium]